MGTLRFAGLNKLVQLDLTGDFHREIRGAKITLKGPGAKRDPQEAKVYMEGFAPAQSGKVGDRTAGLPPLDYAAYPYIEWYSEANGRCVLELGEREVEVVGKPIPAIESDPVDRKKQDALLAGHMVGLVKALNKGSKK